MTTSGLVEVAGTATFLASSEPSLVPLQRYQNDIAAAARAVAAVSRVVASRPDVAEIEVNPLLVCQDGAFGLDARMVLDNPQPEPGS